MPALISTFGSEWEPEDGPVCAECGGLIDDGPALFCSECEAALRLAPVAAIEPEPVIDFDAIPF